MVPVNQDVPVIVTDDQIETGEGVILPSDKGD